jgi:hypothetical protein
MDSRIAQLRQYIVKNETSIQVLNLADDLQLEALKPDQVSRLQEILLMRFVAYFRDTFQMESGYMVVGQDTLNKITLFVEAFTATMETLITVKLPVVEIQDKDHVSKP